MSAGKKQANNALGDLRRSSVVMTFAPGAVVDFRAGGAPVSAVVAGLEEWDRNFPPAGLANPQTIFEPRLQKKLNVAMNDLPAEDRALVHLHYFEGQSLAEIALVMNVSRDALKMRLSRARTKLRTLLGDDDETN